MQRNSSLLEAAKPCNDAAMGALSGAVAARRVVEGLRTVDADADPRTGLPEEVTPFVAFFAFSRSRFLS